MNYKKQLKSRYILILSYIGIAFLIIGVTLLLPILSIPFNLEEASLTKYFIISASISIIAGIAIRKVCKEANTNIRLSLSEAGIIIVVSWLLAIAFSSLTFFISGQLG